VSDAALRAIVTDAVARAIRRRVLEVFNDGPIEYERLVEVVQDELSRVDVRLQEEGYIKNVEIRFDVKL